MNNVQQLLIEYTDLWTAADTTQKLSRGRSSNNTINVYGIKKLRELILELAVRGKLVPQDPHDEPAQELIKHIKAQKAKLTAEGKIKKAKPLSPISENEKLFNLPNGWEWCRLDDISPIPLIDGDWIESKDQDPNGNIRLVQLADIGIGEFKDRSDKFINRDTYKKLNCTQLEVKDILIARLPNPIGRACLFPNLKTVAITVVDVAILRSLGMFCEKYVINAINSATFRKQVEAYGKGATRFRIATGNLKNLLITIPPLNEQRRIVTKIEELMRLCDQLETQHNNSAETLEELVNQLLDTLTQSQNAEEFSEYWQRITAHFDILFTTENSIDTLKQTLLQLAVMGKLVPQDPKDKSANELIKSIIQERDKQIKKNSLKTIAKDEIHDFEMYISIPTSWQYCRLGNLAKFIDYRGKTPSKISSGIPLITAKNVRFGYISREPEEYISATEYKSWMTRGFPQVGDMLFTTEAPLGNIAIIDTSEKCALAQRVICFQLHNRTIAPYLKIAIMSDQFQKQLIKAATGMTATGIKASKLKEIPVPIPPIEEQRRIIAKIDELMAICDQLKNRITEANQLQQKLADVMTEQAVL